MSDYQFVFDELRGRIVSKYGNNKAFAKAIGMSESTLSLKLNNKTPWMQYEIRKAASLLDMNLKDIPSYFFNEKIEKTQKKLIN